MSQKQTTDTHPRFVHLIVLCLLLFSVVLRAALTFNRELDMDEFQHLHSAWMVGHDYLIYRDFWEPHTPLLYYLLLPLFHFFREGAGLVLAARVLMSLTAFGILLLTYALARLGHDRLTSLLAVLVLSFMVIFVQKSIEIRPDQPLVIMWLASLWVAARALAEGRGLKWFFSAGLLLGVGFLFSPKALIPLGAMGLTLLALVLGGQRRPLQGFLSLRSFLAFLKVGCAYAFGFLLPVVACFALFYRAGDLKEMFEDTLFENFPFPHTYHPTYLLYLRNVCFFLLAFAGIFLRARDFKGLSRAARTTHLALLLPALLLLFVILFLVAYPFPQIVLLCAPLFAVYAAEAVRRSLDYALKTRRSPDGTRPERLTPGFKGALSLAAALAAALVIPCVMLLLKERPFTKTNAWQFQRMEYVLSRTRPTDAVFDGEEAYVFRPQAFFYGALVQGIEWRIGQGQIKDDIPQSLSDTGCKVVIYDERVAALPESDQLFIKTHYAPSTEPDVYLAR